MYMSDVAFLDRHVVNVHGECGHGMWVTYKERLN